MKQFFICLLAFFIFTSLHAQQGTYTPSAEVLTARKNFQDMKYGMFIHWGAFSVLADGEWVMNNRKIRAVDYHNLINVFNPVHYDAKKWVSLAKAAGMKYIVFVTRHHDGFSNWDTKQSDWSIMNTPYKKDALKMLTDECKRQGLKIGLYYSLLDWTREDYPHETGRTGQFSGRKGKGDYASYLKFMKAQLTELLTNYGEIATIWFDGHWDQTNPEGQADRSSRIDWKYEEIYGLIHKLQPQCMIGNNHHLTPLPGEDFQMFERDLPGENKSGLSFQKASDQVPLETCETINGSWGYNMTDTNYKSAKTVIHYLVNAAGRNANLLLNIGPFADGGIQQEFTDTLTAVGQWLGKYGESIYSTRGNLVPPQKWGVVTTKDKKVYLHVLEKPLDSKITINQFPLKIKSAVIMGTVDKIKYNQKKEAVEITVPDSGDMVDTIIELTTG